MSSDQQPGCSQVSLGIIAKESPEEGLEMFTESGQAYGAASPHPL